MTPPSVKMRISATTYPPHPIPELRYLRLTPIEGEPVHGEPVQGKAAPSFNFIPGQWLSISYSGSHAGSKRGQFAIASAPGEGDYFDLLIRRGPGMSSILCDLAVGADVEVTGPQGKGFPLEPHRGKNLVLIGVGTGIAPLRSVVRAAARQRRLFQRIMCFYGVLTPRHICFPDEIRAWPDWGVETFLTVTDPDGAPWNSHVGFVQQQVARVGPSPKETIAMLVGMPEMIQANTELLRRLGFLPDAILLNY